MSTVMLLQEQPYCSTLLQAHQCAGFLSCQLQSQVDTVLCNDTYRCAEQAFRTINILHYKKTATKANLACEI